MSLINSKKKKETKWRPTKAVGKPLPSKRAEDVPKDTKGDSKEAQWEKASGPQNKGSNLADGVFAQIGEPTQEGPVIYQKNSAFCQIV